MSQTQGSGSDQQILYASSSEAVRPKGMTEAEAIAFYLTYVDFVIRSSGRSSGRLLDVGCGNGWSSYVFAERGFESTGVDLNSAAFEPPLLPNLKLQEGSVLGLPFAACSFDVVSSYQMLEHVPNPETALREMLRVVRPGGTVSIVSPNLLSILSSLRGLTRYVWRNRPLHTIVFRSESMPRHPPGNTIPELLGTLVGSSARLIGKLMSRRVVFSMRVPDLRPPFHADNDACYLCNPVDIAKFFRSQGCQILQNGQYGRPPLSWLATTGTYVTARKP
jgi:SAM-dependent methyltransferase